MSHRFAADAPGRCGIIGNPSDIYGGVVVSCSIPLRNQCSLYLGEEGVLDGDLRLWSAAIKRLPLSGKYTVKWTGTVPRSSGLSGSTAALASMLLCLLAARGELPNLEDKDARSAFAELLRDCERNDAGIVCGYQDAYMIAHGGVQRMNFAGKHPVNPGPTAALSPIDSPLPFLLVTTGVERLSGSVHGPMAQRWMDGETKVVDGMVRIAELGALGASALTESRWDDLAELMNENQRIIAELGGSGEAIDRLIGACRKAGSPAAKLAGAGMGGTVIALTQDPLGLREALAAEGYTRVIRPSREPGVRLEAGPAV